MLKNLQGSLVSKIATSNIKEYPGIQEMLESVIPIGFFSKNKQQIQNISMILTKALEPAKVRLIYDEPTNTMLGEATL